MPSPDLSEIYRGYIDCLNRQDWDTLPDYLDDDVVHNGRAVGVAGYRAMLEKDFREIPDLVFTIALLVADESHVASRLMFDCTPVGQFLGLAIDGRSVQFAENVIYAFRQGKICEVWSLVDRAAIEAQIANAA